jgi:3',5'-cyclic-AMP phosphodiesterase
MKNPLLTFIHITDTHIPADPNEEPRLMRAYNNAKALVKQINSLPFEPDFVLHTGDAAYDPEPEHYRRAREVLQDIRYPVYYVAGNHDDAALLQTEIIGKNEPVVPFHYEFEVKGVQFIVLDSNGPAEPPAGLISEQQLVWLRERCAADDSRPLVIAVHHNPQIGGVPWLDEFTAIQNTEAFHEAMLPAKDRLRGVFFGHIHQNLDIYRDGILYCSTLSSWVQYHAWPGQTETEADPDDGPGFSVVMIYPNQTVVRRHRFTPVLE